MKWTKNGAILLTGGSQRVGLHCVQQLLSLGERVVITYRTEKATVKELRAEGVVCIQSDFNQTGDIEDLIQIIKQQIGPLRAIVHNASSWVKDVDTPVDYEQVMNEMVNVHMMAPYLVNLHLHDLLLRGADGWSDIIHITDYVVEEGSDNHIAYAACKAGLDNMTRSFAKRYAPHVKVNSIAPSLLLFNKNDSDEYRMNTISKSPMAMEPGPDVVFQGLEFILNNAYITGRELKLDGGRHIR